MSGPDPVSRLTENEKLCLRRKMHPETSKEIARALDISVHAVDKRLKTARLKLGVSTTLEAARLLAKAESGYQVLVPQQLDLPDIPVAAHSRPQAERKTALFLAAGMGGAILIIAIVLFASQTSPVPDHRAPDTMAEAEAFLGASFDFLDRDRSGFIEDGEQPPIKTRRIASDGQTADTQLADGSTSTALFDTDGDRRVSRAEYISHLLPMVLERGIPVNWKPSKSRD